MKRWPRRTFILAVIALVAWGIGMPLAFLSDGGWRVTGFVVWLPAMVGFWILLAREMYRRAAEDERAIRDPGAGAGAGAPLGDEKGPHRER